MNLLAMPHAGSLPCADSFRSTSDVSRAVSEDGLEVPPPSGASRAGREHLRAVQGYGHSGFQIGTGTSVDATRPARARVHQGRTVRRDPEVH